MPGRWDGFGYAVAGVAVGLGASVSARVLIRNPLARGLLTAGGVMAAAYVPQDGARHALQGVLTVSAAVDLIHLKSWITHASAPRSGVGAVEAELTRATPWDASDSISAPFLRHPAAPAVSVPASTSAGIRR